MILAAGMSKRFGDDPPKQLVEIGGVPQIRRIAIEAMAADFNQVVAVLGHRAKEVSACLSPLDIRQVAYPAYRYRQSASVKAGLALVALEADAAMFIPCDMPFLNCATLQLLLATYRKERPAILIASHQGRYRAPVLWDRSLFAELETLTGDQGARQLFTHHQEEIHRLEITDGRLLADFNTPEELAALLPP